MTSSWSPRGTKHVEEVNAILKPPRESLVTLTLDQCAFFKNRLRFLGHTILPGQMKVPLALTKEIMETPFPLPQDQKLVVLRRAQWLPQICSIIKSHRSTFQCNSPKGRGIHL